jgi:gamma-glutamylcysteine synthetase
MPINRQVLTMTAVEDLCTTLFAPSEERVGLELEWLVHRQGSAAVRPTPAEMTRLAQRRLPAGGQVTFEPGGQIELSTAPQCGVGAALEAACADERALKAELAAAGLAAETMAVDGRQPPRPVRMDLAPARAWLNYALAADVMFINREGSQGDDGIGLSPGLPFGNWLAHGHHAGWPTIEDFRYHLSTLFPPIRPRGWLELRMLDALPRWIRAVATLTVATSCTRQAGRELRRRLPPTQQLWLAAARHGLRHPVLHTAARELFTVVSDHLSRVSDRQEDADLLQAYRRTYVDPGRTPADDHGRDVDLRLQVSALAGG